MATDGNPLTDHLDLWTSALLNKSTAGRGSNGKQEAYGIKKLRELILELAVRGKLVPQDPNDEPASVLLKTIAEEKERLTAEGKLKQERKTADIAATPKPFDLPDRWIWCDLSDLLALVTDGDHQPPPQTQYGVPFLVIGNLNSGKINLDNCKSVSPEYYENLDWSRKPVSGDILYTVTGSFGIPVPIEIEEQFCVQRHVAILKATDSTPQKYIFLTLGSTLALKFAASIATGIAQKTVPLTGLRRMPIPLAPRNEQYRIVAKVDELMALCHRLEQQQAYSLEAHQTLVETLLGALTNTSVRPEPVEGRPSTARSFDRSPGSPLTTNGSGRTEFEEAWSRIADHFDTLFTTEHSIDLLKQTILQLAVMGKLVPQDPDDEPASVILETAATRVEKTKNKVRDQRSGALPETDSRDLPFELPFSWKWALIGDICGVQGGIQKQPTRTPKANYYPYLRVANVQRGYLDLTEISHFELYDGELEKWSLKRGDILVVEGNGSEDEIGRCAIWDGTIDNCVYQNHLIRIRTFLPKLEIYIARFLNSQSGIDAMKRLAVTTSGLYNLSVGKIRSISVPIPPLAEQHRIVAKVDELMAVCDTLKARLKTAQSIQIHLADAIVERAVA